MHFCKLAFTLIARILKANVNIFVSQRKLAPSRKVSTNRGL